MELTKTVKMATKRIESIETLLDPQEIVNLMVKEVESELESDSTEIPHYFEGFLNLNLNLGQVCEVMAYLREKLPFQVYVFMDDYQKNLKPKLVVVMGDFKG